MAKNEVHLFVFAVMADGQVLKAGRILSENLHIPGAHQGFFKYDPAFLNHPSAYPLDPVHLPLVTNKVFAANNPNTGIHSVFEDSLPDAWGRQILARQGGLDRHRSRPAHLLGALQGRGLGRLVYSDSEQMPAIGDHSLSFAKITLAIQEAHQFEKSSDIELQDIQHLLACGSSAGGARPKVLTEKDGRFYIAKLSSIRDPEPDLLISLEHSGMTLARQAGLTVPDFEVVPVENRNVFLVERFDIDDKGRNALISFKTLIGGDDYYEVKYADLANIVRKYSYRPKDDVELLYRQMITNVLIRNTDDHLQNFCMLHTKNGFALSPTFDMVPNIYQSGQILKINGNHDQIVRQDLIEEGKNFLLSAQKSQQILDDVGKSLSNWQDIFWQCRVPEQYTVKLREDIAKRFKAIA